MRPTIDHTLMDIARVWEARSTCSRNHVGAVIARDRRHIGSGYNGAPAGLPHCEHLPSEFTPRVQGFILNPSLAPGQPWPMDKGCPTAIHAEANALAYCARFGIAVEGATIYTTLSPCYACAQLIIAAGLIRVVYGRAYRDVKGISLLDQAGIRVERWMDLS